MAKKVIDVIGFKKGPKGERSMFGRFKNKSEQEEEEEDDEDFDF